jgi:hypothetical protein
MELIEEFNSSMHFLSLNNIVKEASAAQSSLRIFECMADFILSGEHAIPDEISLGTMKVCYITLEVDLRNS